MIERLVSEKAGRTVLRACLLLAALWWLIFASPAAHAEDHVLPGDAVGQVAGTASTARASTAAPVSSGPVSQVPDAVEPNLEQTPAPVEQIVKPAVEQTVAPVKQIVKPVVEQTVAPVEQIVKPVVERTVAPVGQIVKPVVEQTVPPVEQIVKPVDQVLQTESGRVERPRQQEGSKRRDVAVETPRVEEAQSGQAGADAAGPKHTDGARAGVGLHDSAVSSMTDDRGAGEPPSPEVAAADLDHPVHKAFRAADRLPAETQRSAPSAGMEDIATHALSAADFATGTVTSPDADKLLAQRNEAPGHTPD